MYEIELGALIKKCNSSIGLHSTTSQAPVVHQIKETCETINKLNVERMTKDGKRGHLNFSLPTTSASVTNIVSNKY